MRTLGRAFSLVLPLFIAACGVDKSAPPIAGPTVGALAGPSISTDSSSYALGATITVTYAGLPGNLKDWIAIAPAGSDNTNFVAFVFTNGQTSGTATFPATAAGSYVARSFSNNTFTLVAESPAFTVLSSSATISTDQSTYPNGATITVTWAGLPGNLKDWIAIAPAGSDNTSFVDFVFTNGQTSGTATFTAPASGSYVARAFSNNTFTLVAESPAFSVGTLTISTDQSTYAPGSTITVTYAGLPGNLKDWIAIAPAGSDNTSFVDFVFTNGQTSGTATFIAPAAGSYVARAFSNNTFTLLVESTAFTVGGSATISTDQSTYAPGATVTVTFAGLPGNQKDWLAIAAAGSDNTSFVAFVFTNGQTSGTATFTAPAAGSYVARAFSNNTFTLLAESSAFTVGTAATISTDHATYAPGATITVTYAGLPGNQKDWIAIAAAGSDNTSFVDFVFTNGQTSGTATFTAPAAGSYVARAFSNNTFTLLVESTAFTVGAGATISTDHATYAPGATITVTWTGLPGNQQDWIAIATAGSANTSFVDFVFTNGQTSGTATFTAPAAGSYVARAFSNNTYDLVVESTAFTVSGAAATISTNHPIYPSGSTVTVTWAGLPGNQQDWIAIAASGSANTSFVDFVFTNGQTSGTANFPVPAAGSYVARAFTNNTYDLAAQSSVFTVCESGGVQCFVATLSGNEEVPVRATSATGSATFAFDPATRTIVYQVQHTVVNASAGHIHQQAPGINGSIIVPFTLVGQGATGEAVLTVGQAADLQAGNLYTNIHSPTFPGGEVRGQILRPGHILYVATLNEAQEVGPTGSTATGTGSVIWDPATNNIIYRVVHTVVNPTAGHIHQAPVGVIGGVIVPFTLVGQGANGTATLTAGQATALQSAGLYMNIHSAAFPGGEIRGVLLIPGT
jgi:ABC-type sulfate transport system substrate-binding protein